MRKNSSKKNINWKQILIIAITIVLFIGLAYISDNVNTLNKVTVANYSNMDDIPQYSGQTYVEINNNNPYFTEEDYTTKPFEKYSNLDEKGRCGVAYANICKEIMPPNGDKRGDISSIKPTGWIQKKYNGEYLYNRCHLIGHQLSDEDANELNLITGTRYFNVNGMLPFENKVADYIKRHRNNHVLYRVTPIYKEDNLIASGVQIEAYSVEDKGKEICFNVYVYNVQPGITINYKTGESKEN